MFPRKKHLFILIIATLVLLLLVLFEPALGVRLRSWLGPKNIAPSDAARLAAENEVLQAQLAELQSVQAQLLYASSTSYRGIRAMVYSNYPFGFARQIVVNVGSNDGVAVGKTVTYQGIFIGLVVNVFPDSAVVQTMFDPNFKMPVRIGSHGFDGLLVGGAYPKATSISKDSVLSIGDIVSTAAAGFPYGLAIGTVAATSTSPDGLFQEAALDYAYDINTIQTVLIAQ